MADIGKTLIVLGGALVVIGALLILVGRVPGAGRLPGDLFIQRGSFTFYVPLATSLVLSVVITLVLWLIGRR